jgi:glycosyltransferase involved in cell wall biosynthesis
MHVTHLAPPWIPVPPLTYGGTELMVATLIRGLRQHGLQITLFAARDSTLEVPCLGPFPDSFWPPDKFSENLHLSFAFQHLKKNPPQLIHTHLENAAGFWALAAPEIPLVITLHTPLTPIKIDYLQTFPQARVVAVSLFQAGRLTGHPNLRVIPHGLELENYPFQAGKEDFLLFLGRIYADKGLHTAVRLARETGVRLLIAGPVFEPDQPYFEQEIRPYLDGARIRHLGPVDFAAKVDLLKRAKALIFPLEVDEAFGLAMLEGLACGTPVLAYRRGAVTEVVAHGVTGFVVSSYDDLRQALRQLRDLDPQVCRDHVHRHFSATRMTAAYLALYGQ